MVISKYTKKSNLRTVPRFFTDISMHLAPGGHCMHQLRVVEFQHGPAGRIALALPILVYRFHIWGSKKKVKNDIVLGALEFQIHL